MPLNQQLYELLLREFQQVKIFHPGEKMVFSSGFDPVYQRKVMLITDAGEEYAVNCPCCGDTKKRLVINHRWGYEDPEYGRNQHLCHCFNETNCMSNPDKRYDLYKRVYGFKNVNQRQVRTPAGILEGVEPSMLGPITLPGTCVPLKKVSLNERPLVWLRARGYDPSQLDDIYKVTFCSVAEDRYHTAEGRIIVPIEQDGKLVGWQGRYPADSKKWDYFPKYYSCPGMRKSLMLYNIDNAKRQNMAVMCEGPLDVWRVGCAGVAIFGNTPSPHQQTLLARYWRDGLLIVLLDSDEAGRVGTKDTLEKLNGKIKHLVPVELEAGKSPNSYTRIALWEIIEGVCQKQGIELGDFSVERTDDDIEAGRNEGPRIGQEERRMDAAPAGAASR